MLSGLKPIFSNMSNGSLNAVCFSALTVHGGHLQIMFAALFMLMSGPVIRDTEDNAWESHWYHGIDYGADCKPQTVNN